MTDKSQISMTKIQYLPSKKNRFYDVDSFWTLEFGHWNLFGIWNLRFVYLFILGLDITACLCLNSKIKLNQSKQINNKEVQFI